MERVRGKKEYPFVYFISYFNPNIPLTGEEDYTRPLYEMLETQYNIVVKTSKEEISARLAGEFIAEKLEIKSNDPILIRKSLLRIEGVGKTSYYHLLSKLQMIGVVDESLDRILAGCSNGKFDNK